MLVFDLIGYDFFKFVLEIFVFVVFVVFFFCVFFYFGDMFVSVCDSVVGKLVGIICIGVMINGY